MAYIKERIIKKGADRNGKMKENLKVYDVFYTYKDPATGVMKKNSKKGFRLRKDAENYITEINSNILNNKFVVPKKLTVREFLLEWLDTYVIANLKKTTIDGYKRNIEKHIIPCLGSVELQSLTVNNIDSFYSDRLKNGRLDGKGGLSPKSLQYIHRVLSEAMEHAVRKNLIPRNVVKDTTNKPKPKRFKNNIYNDVELNTLLTLTKGTYFEAAVALGGIYGLRRGEVLGLRWSDVNFCTCEISICQQLVPIENTITFDSTKSEESNRTLPITAELKEILQRRKDFQERQIKLMNGRYEENNMVVCNNDGSLIDPRNFSKRFASLLKKHNLKHIRFHDLRHTCATLMINSGVDLKVTSTWLGHSSIGITAETYVKVVSDAKKNAAEKVSNMVFGREEVKQ